MEKKPPALAQSAQAAINTIVTHTKRRWLKSRPRIDLDRLNRYADSHGPITRGRGLLTGTIALTLAITAPRKWSVELGCLPITRCA